MHPLAVEARRQAAMAAGSPDAGVGPGMRPQRRKKKGARVTPHGVTESDGSASNYGGSSRSGWHTTAAPEQSHSMVLQEGLPR
eukprot:6609127-Pyramimonas_sp.AAC.1